MAAGTPSNIPTWRRYPTRCSRAARGRVDELIGELGTDDGGTQPGQLLGRQQLPRIRVAESGPREQIGAHLRRQVEAVGDRAGVDAVVGGERPLDLRLVDAGQRRQPPGEAAAKEVDALDVEPEASDQPPGHVDQDLTVPGHEVQAAQPELLGPAQHPQGEPDHRRGDHAGGDVTNGDVVGIFDRQGQPGQP